MKVKVIELKVKSKVKVKIKIEKYFQCSPTASEKVGRKSRCFLKQKVEAKRNEIKKLTFRS